MKHYVCPGSEFRIVQNTSSGVGEITISLNLTGPSITVTNAAYIGGAYDSSSGKKNPGIPYCQIDEPKPVFTDNWNNVSASSKKQVTLTLKSKLKQL